MTVRGVLLRFLSMAATLFACDLAAFPALAEGAPAADAADPAGATAPKVPVAHLLTDEAALAAWLTARHPDIGASGARVRQAEALSDQSRVIPNPTLGMAVGGMPLGARNPPSLSFGDAINVSVGVAETVEISKRGPRAQAASLRRDASRADAQGILVNRLADARDAMARTIYFAERARVLSERLASAENVVLLEKVRLEKGDISGIEHDRLELEAARVARELTDTRAELDLALADCSARLLGDCGPEGATLDAVDASAPLPPSLGVDALVQNRPDLRAARLATDAARTDAVLYGRYWIPDPTLGLTYTRDFLVMAGNQPNTLMASVSMPLPFFDHGQHLARAARASAEELEFTRRAVEIRAVSDARVLLDREKILEKKLGILVTTSLPKAIDVLNASDNAYHHGQLSLTDLIIVRREHAALLLESVETRYALFAVRNDLYRTLGLGAPAAPRHDPSTPSAAK